MNVTKLFRRLIQEDDGPTTVEYAVMLALILGVIIGTVAIVGSNTNDLYTEMGTQVENAVTGSN